MFSIAIWCAPSFGSICLYVRSIFFMFLGEIPYFIKKSHIRRFDSIISSIANLEMLLHLNFYWWFLYWGHFRTILVWLPLWATVGNPFYRQNSKMAAKWRHTIWMFLCIHKTWSVIHVIEGFRGHIIHFYWYYVHLTSLEPIFWSSVQDAQNKPRLLPPPPPNHFHRAKWLCDTRKSTRSPHFR